MDPSRRKQFLIKWGLILGFVTVVGLLNFGVVMTSKLSEREFIPYK